jgi:hypothetical protein
MKKVLVIYLPIIIITLLVSLPFIFPARLIALALIPQFTASQDQQVGQQKIALSDIQGAIKEGSASVFYDALPLGTLSWNTELPALINGNARVNLTLTSDSHNLQARVIVNREQIRVEELHGYIRAPSVNPYSRTYGLALEGELKLASINLQLQNGWLDQLAGDLSWTGGTIQYQAANARATYQLSPLTGELSLPEHKARLRVNDASSAAEVLNVQLTDQGWATATILRRFFDLAGKQWIITDSADDIALQLEQKLW